MHAFVVIDFETSGLSPAYGARPTEVALVRVEGRQVVDRYQSLMNAGVRVPPDIQALTGITNAMLRTAPPAARVMEEAARFVGSTPLLAHNAAFDSKFWEAEMARLGRPAGHPFLCSLLLARRLYPELPNHKLGTLVSSLGLTMEGRAHRALADAQATAEVLFHMLDTLETRHRLPAQRIHLETLARLQKTPAAKVGAVMGELRGLEGGVCSTSARDPEV